MKRHGFTLIELVIVIVLVGIIAAVVTPIVTNQFSAYTDSSRRATLVQEAQTLMQQLERDLYQAVPNSIAEVGDDGFALLALSRPDAEDDSTALPAGRYVDAFSPSQPTTPGAGNPLKVLGCLTTADTQHVVLFPAGSGSALAAWEDLDGSTNEGPVSRAIDGIDDPCDPNEPATINLPDPHRFDPGGDGSLFNRFYLTEGRIDWACDLSAGTLSRDQSFDPTGPRRASSAISACDFEFIPGATYSAPSLLADITLTREGESVRLVRVFQLANAP